MSTNLYLFIGGHLDGERRKVEDGPLWVETVVPRALSSPSLTQFPSREDYMKTSRYRRESICGAIFFVAESMSNSDAIEHLIKNYHPPQR